MTISFAEEMRRVWTPDFVVWGTHIWYFTDGECTGKVRLLDDGYRSWYLIGTVYENGIPSPFNLSLEGLEQWPQS
jgi:hypothetical protein